MKKAKEQTRKEPVQWRIRPRKKRKKKRRKKKEKKRKENKKRKKKKKKNSQKKEKRVLLCFSVLSYFLFVSSFYISS